MSIRPATFCRDPQSVLMRFKPLEIPPEGKEFAFDLSPEELPRLSAEVKPLRVTCRVFVQGMQERMRLKSEYNAQLQKPCDQCLKQTSLSLQGEFNLTLLPSYMDNAPPGGDGEISPEMADIDYYDGNKINLAPYIEDQLILELPLRTLCNPDCKGLCPLCGQDLNEKSCDCEEPSTSRPFAQLKNLISNPKQE